MFILFDIMSFTQKNNYPTISITEKYSLKIYFLREKCYQGTIYFEKYCIGRY